MRAITPKLTKDLQIHCGRDQVWRAPAFGTSTFRQLVEQVARLAYENRDELLFFRGQDKDYQSKADGTTLYPAIYRGDAVLLRELRYRFDLLDQASRRLVDFWNDAKINGYTELRQKRYIQWSILQHYEVTATPLLDLTHSLRVACSFAQLRSTDPRCYVYVLGLPYITNRISINSEHDLVNIRLLSICPPDAIRPFFQEGYLAGTTDLTTDFDSKTELDFRNRLIAKFEIPRASSKFWGAGFDRIPDSALFPKGDMILDLCNQLKSELKYELQPGEIGAFIKDWADLEAYLLKTGRRITERNLSVREAITALAERHIISNSLAKEVQGIRNFRNNVVHKPSNVRSHTLAIWRERLRGVLQQIDIG